jgi:HPt (histidine-containing phosphotransfer) domain-containing protein
MAETSCMDQILLSAPLNLESLSTFFDNDLEIIEFLRDESFPVLRELLVDLSNAVANQEGDRSAKLAHKIRGGASAIGANEIDTAMSMIESKAKSSEWESIDSWLTVAKTSMDRINAWMIAQS